MKTAFSGGALALLLTVFICVTFAGQMADQALEKREERLRNSKVGDWVEYDQTVGLDAIRTNLAHRIRVTVTQKDDQSVTLKTVRVKTNETLGEEKVVFGQPRQAKDPNKIMAGEAPSPLRSRPESWPASATPRSPPGRPSDFL